ncbi:MAG: hypothetical protein AAGA48_36795 [Myxococcota bacterium]
MMTRIRTLFLAVVLVACGAPSAETSLTGTDLDGAFTFDPALVLDDGARRAFDYALLVEDELPEAEFAAWFEARLRAHDLDEAHVAEVRAAFEGYVDYRRQAAQILERPSGNRVQARADLDQLVTDALGTTPLATSERQRLDRGFAMADALALPDQRQRQAAIQALTAEDEAQFRQTTAGRYRKAQAAITEAKEAGASPSELAAIRTRQFATFGSAALARLEALEARRAAFRSRIEALAKVPESERAARMIEQFSPDERRRVPGALLRLEAMN